MHKGTACRRSFSVACHHIPCLLHHFVYCVGRQHTVPATNSSNDTALRHFMAQEIAGIPHGICECHFRVISEFRLHGSPLKRCDPSTQLPELVNNSILNWAIWCRSVREGRRYTTDRILKCLLKSSRDFTFELHPPSRLMELVLEQSEPLKVEWDVIDFLRDQNNRPSSGVGKSQLIEDVCVTASELGEQDFRRSDSLPNVIHDESRAEYAVCSDGLKPGILHGLLEYLRIAIKGIIERHHHEASSLGPFFDHCLSQSVSSGQKFTARGRLRAKGSLSHA